jgi:hypothetical protein
MRSPEHKPVTKTGSPTGAADKRLLSPVQVPQGSQRAVPATVMLAFSRIAWRAR